MWYLKGQCPWGLLHAAYTCVQMVEHEHTKGNVAPFPRVRVQMEWDPLLASTAVLPGALSAVFGSGHAIRELLLYNLVFLCLLEAWAPGLLVPFPLFPIPLAGISLVCFSFFFSCLHGLPLLQLNFISTEPVPIRVCTQNQSLF